MIYNEERLKKALIEQELISYGAEVAICKMVETGNIDVERIAMIGNAVTDAKNRVNYCKGELEAEVENV